LLRFELKTTPVTMRCEFCHRSSEGKQCNVPGMFEAIPVGGMNRTSDVEVPPPTSIKTPR